MTEKKKAKSYDEAIERAKKLHGNGITKEIFLELKESKDKKIREAILNGLIDCRDALDLGWSNFGGIHIDDCIDWLEKQCEPNPYSGVSFKYNGHTWCMCGRDNGVEILVDGEIKERIFLDNKPKGKSALEAIKEEKVDNANKINRLNIY